MESSSKLTHFSLLLTILFPITTTTSSTTTAPPDQNTNPFDFIRSRCNATLYPDVCFISLSRYATSVQSDPCHLATVAITVTLSQARRASAYFSNLAHRADIGPLGPLRDCASTFSDAVDQMRGSLRQMRHLESGGGGGPVGAEGVRFQLSNVQTWMSAAMTNEDTCADGFADVDDCPVKDDVCQWVGDVRHLTSNALALVNSFAASVVGS